MHAAVPPLEPSFATKLIAVLGHDRVYPNAVPLIPQNDDQEDCDYEVQTPAASYRMISERGVECFDGVHGPYVAQFLVEVFASTPDLAMAHRQKLKAEFRGPSVPGNIGAWTKWLKGGPSVKWAQYQDPSSGDDFPVTDAHDIVHYERAVIEVTYDC